MAYFAMMDLFAAVKLGFKIEGGGRKRRAGVKNVFALRSCRGSAGPLRKWQKASRCCFCGEMCGYEMSTFQETCDNPKRGKLLCSMEEG